MEEESIINLNSKTVELIVNESVPVGSSIIKNSATTTNGTGKKEDEKITTAVMKVLQGYQWSLVPAQTKYVSYSFICKLI